MTESSQGVNSQRWHSANNCGPVASYGLHTPPRQPFYALSCPLSHGDTSPTQVKYDCLALHGIASRLREARFKSGALRLNNTRLFFAMDTGGNPVSASPYVQTAANFLVEEYMLLANMRVAAIIARAFPKHAMLR